MTFTTKATIILCLMTDVCACAASFAAGLAFTFNWGAHWVVSLAGLWAGLLALSGSLRHELRQDPAFMRFIGKTLPTRQEPQA